MSSGYRIKVETVPGTVTALRSGSPLVSGNNAKLMRETRLSDTIYFPRTALQGHKLSPSSHRTFCPFKGTAKYWDVVVNDVIVANAIWSYENALSEGREIEGMLGLMPFLVDTYEFSGTAPQSSQDDHISGPLVDWLMRDAAFCTSGIELTQQLANQLLTHGIAIYRMGILLWSLHPEIAGIQYIWHRDKTDIEVRCPNYSTLELPEFSNSPLRYVMTGLGGIRQPLTVTKPEFQFPILDELRTQGATDYVAMPLPFSDGRKNVLTLASDHPTGFTTANLGLIFECASVISRYYEVYTLRDNAVSLLDTYVGKRAGSRVLDGEIRRGDGDTIEAAILYCDLCGSTRLAETLSSEAYLTILNGFFERVSDAVVKQDGEVLKFIGDAVLAIFPEGDNISDAKQRAANAASAIPDVISAFEPQHELACAIGVAFGTVTYGNVGAPDRLDFTVIGSAAIIAARLSDLAKTQSHAVLMTQEVAGELTDVESLGNFELHNIAKPIEVFSWHRAN